MSRAAALLATALALPARASAAAPSAASSLASLREDYATALRWGRYWIAVDDADRLDAVPGLPPTERAGLLVDGARARFLIGDAAGAERDLRRALALEPGGAEASYRLAALLRDRPDEALPYAERAARAAAAAPRRAAAERLAGEIRLDLGDEAGARSSLRRALSLSGGDLETLQDLARLERRRPREASALARRALHAAEAAPPWARPPAFLLCARIWLDVGDAPEAVAAAERALALEPDDLYALEALVRIKREHPGLAIALDPSPAPSRPPVPAPTEASLLESLRADPADLGALGGLVSLERARKNVPEELSYAERFMDAALAAPRWEQPAAYRFITDAWLDGGDEAKLSLSLGLAKDLDRRSLEIQFLTRRVGGRGFKSEGDVENMAVAYVDIARARAELGDAAGAERCLESALELVPGDPDARRLLQEVSGAQRSDSGTR